MNLATKITLPFLALFCAVLIALGVVLARQLVSAVEQRTETEQRFVLEVATFPGFSFTAETLRQIRSRANPAAGAGGRAEFLVLQGGGPDLSTFEDGRGAAVAADLRQALLAHRMEPPAEAVQRTLQPLGGSHWLVLYTSRGSLAGAPDRFTFLLYPYAEIERAQTAALRDMSILGLAGLVLAGGLGTLIATWIARPIRTLATTAREVSSRGLDAAAPEVSLQPWTRAPQSDELGELARAFEAMLANLRRSQAELLRAERLASAGRLAASVAHEIRNPLTSMRMTVQMLQSRCSGDPSAAQGLAIVLGEIDRLALAVDELLTVARPHPPQRVPCNLHELIAATLQFMERQLAHSQIVARTEFDAALPERVLLDPNKIRQVLVNLILNALEAMVRKGTVTVRTRWDAAAQRVTVSVADTGPGIPESVRERVFELFVSTKAGGGGLGLAIARQIAEEHGGSLRFETSAQGTVFHLELPAV